MGIYYRPKWVCGRYNAPGKVAIVYNLLEGISYLFEDYSALVVSFLLDVQRGQKVDVANISKQTGILQESILHFFEELASFGLLLDHLPTEEEETDYRKQISLHNRIQAAKVETTQEKLPMFTSTAEMEYAEKAGGITSVMFELTYRCSEKCIHCYNIGATRNNEEQSGRALLKELQLEDYKRIIDEQYVMKLENKICLTNGHVLSPILLQYSVECPCRICDAAYMPKEEIWKQVALWEKYNRKGYTQSYLVAAEVLVNNLRILHSNRVLHNAIHPQNYTWALELLDFEISCSPKHPYTLKEETHFVKELFPREIMQTYDVINYIASCLNETINHAKVEDLFSQNGFDIRNCTSIHEHQ